MSTWVYLKSILCCHVLIDHARSLFTLPCQTNETLQESGLAIRLQYRKTDCWMWLMFKCVMKRNTCLASCSFPICVQILVLHWTYSFIAFIVWCNIKESIQAELLHILAGTPINVSITMATICSLNLFIHKHTATVIPQQLHHSLFTGAATYLFWNITKQNYFQGAVCKIWP